MWSEVIFIGTFSRLYLLFEWRELLLVVDQHAFHERILFEKFMANPGLLCTSQKLVIPECVPLGVEEWEQLVAKQDQLKKWGYDIAPVGNHSAEVRALPTLVRNRDVASLVLALLTPEASDLGLQAEINAHHIVATAACHSAVRAGEELTSSELHELLKQASAVDFYHNCPHGRRVLSWWTRNEVAHLFDRPSSAATAYSGLRTTYTSTSETLF